MIFKLNRFILFCVFIINPIALRTAQPPKKFLPAKTTRLAPAKTVAQPTLPKKITRCAKPAKVPYAAKFKASGLPSNLKTLYGAAWGNLYAAYLAKNASTDQNSNEWLALKRKAFINNPFCQYTPLGQDSAEIQDLDICLDAPSSNQSSNIIDCQKNIASAYAALTSNYLEDMQTYLSPATLPKFKNDPLNIQYNYATTHLYKALDRLSKTCSITVKNEEPVTQFSGSIADLGIIVNITNNSDRLFYVTDQDSSKTPIARIERGLNGVNLYTAALYQAPAKNNQPSLPPCFAFFEIATATMELANNQPLFTIGIYTGAELIGFLKTLPRKDPAIFEMNGRPTSEEYLANPQDQYMVLIQDPTPTGTPVRKPSQRIQAINLSTLTGPYLLTMQINEITVEPSKEHGSAAPNSYQGITKILQPALTTVQIIKKPTQKTNGTVTSMEQSVSTAANNTAQTPTQAPEQTSIAQELDRSLLPLIILPQGLWNIQDMQLLWMLYATSYIGALTDFSCFGPNNFANAFEYFSNLGYFSTDHEYRFIIDKYNLLKTGETLFDASWLMECALYESDKEYCSDIPGIYSAQNSSGQMVANASSFYNTNLQISLVPKLLKKPNQEMFNQTNFNSMYNMPYHQIFTLILSIPTTDLKASAFLDIQEVQPSVYKFTWSNKKNIVLNSQVIRIDFEIKDLLINFLTNLKNWTGTTINLRSNQKASFKINYFSSLDDKHSITATPLLSIDKIETIHTVEFQRYPLSDLYLDLYNTVNVAPYTRFYLFQNSNQPSFLQNLNQQDWENGIYLIPSIKNVHKGSSLNTFTLSVTFYKSDKKTILGTISDNISTLKPILEYSLGSAQFRATILEMYISTGILLKYASFS